MESESCYFSFITYVLPEKKYCLKDMQKTIKDIKKELKKDNISMEWIIMVDGESDEYNLKHADKVIKNYSQQGISISKNKALDEAVGEWIVPIDANETLHPESINILLLTAKQSPEIKWIISNKPKSTSLENKKIERGLLSEMYQKQQINIAYPNNVIIRKEILTNPAIKGWINTPSHEDIGTLLVISELSSGKLVDEPLSTPIEEEKQCKIRMMNQPFSFNKISEIINKIRDKQGKEDVLLSKTAC
jgi:glycosyltransferase involved in cell wall biosynthesis